MSTQHLAEEIRTRLLQKKPSEFRMDPFKVIIEEQGQYDILAVRQHHAITITLVDREQKELYIYTSIMDNTPMILKDHRPYEKIAI